MLWGGKGAGRAGPMTSSSENPTRFHLACKSWPVLEHFFRSPYSFLKNPLWFYSSICKFYCSSLWPYTGLLVCAEVHAPWYDRRVFPLLWLTCHTFASQPLCGPRFSAFVPLHTLLAVSALLKGPGDTARLPGLG